MAQLAFTLGLILVSFDVTAKVTMLAAVYMFCLFLDFCVVSRPPT